MISGISRKNKKRLDELAREIKGPFSAKEASDIFNNMPRKETSLLLTYFTTKGWLSRVKRGLYIIVPLGTDNPSKFKENPWIIANRIFAPGYIGGWSAAEYWEFTDQIFNSIIVFTLRKFRKKNMQVQETDFVLKFVKEKYFGKTKSVWGGNEKVNVSDPIQTIVDMLDDPYIGGGIRNISEMIKEYFLSKYRADNIIIDYIESKNNRAIFKRLGYLIEACAIDAPVLRETCEKKISAGFSLLDPAVESKGKFNSKWNLRINVSVDK